MLKLNQYAIIIFLTASTAACSHDSSPNTGAPGSYPFNSNGCNTGAYTYSSQAETCQKLADNEPNNSCTQHEHPARASKECPAPVPTPAARDYVKEACMSYSSASLQEQCLDNLKAVKYVEDIVGEVCLDYSSASLREDCLQNLGNTHIDQRYWDVCRSYSSTSLQEDCLKNHAL